MKKISQLNEGMWGSALKRSNSGEERREDKIQSIDLGLDVLWSADDLVINGKYLFTWKEIHDYTKNGWRLPTQKECDQLLGGKRHGDTHYKIGSDENEVIIIHKNKESISLFKDKNEEEWNYWENYSMETELGIKGGVMNITKYDSFLHGSFFPYSAYKYESFKDDVKKYRVRLVKDYD